MCWRLSNQVLCAKNISWAWILLTIFISMLLLIYCLLQRQPLFSQTIILFSWDSATYPRTHTRIPEPVKSGWCWTVFFFLTLLLCVAAPFSWTSLNCRTVPEAPLFSPRWFVLLVCRRTSFFTFSHHVYAFWANSLNVAVVKYTSLFHLPPKVHVGSARLRARVFSYFG